MEICSDSDWAADRETRQSVSCGAIFVNGNMIHFQSKRQRSISLSSCESETIAAVSIMSEGILIKKLIERITGIEPEVRLYIDSSSSRQLISRKGLGNARHLDVNLLWIQKMKNVIVKPIKGTENPADLGTKALSRDKIRKYMKALGYKGEFEEEEPQPRKTAQTKSISVGMIAKIVAVLLSEGFSVEAAKVGFKSSTPWVSGFFLLVLVCMVMVAFVSMKCLSAAVLAQAEGLGKEGKEKRLKGKKREEKEILSDQERPSEPEPTEHGPEVMQRRAEELRAMALQSKEQREQQLAAASGAADMTNPSDEMDVEEEGEKEEEQEKEKEKPAAEEENPETRASEAAEETESSSSYSSDSSDKPAAEEEKPETRASEAQNLAVVPRDEEEAPVPSVVPRDEEEANKEDEEEGARAAAMKRFDENFVEALKPLGTKVLNDKHCTSRTISGLLSTLMTVLCEPSEFDAKSLKALQSLGELNRETKHSLKAGLERNSQFQAYLRATARTRRL